MSEHEHIHNHEHDHDHCDCGHDHEHDHGCDCCSKDYSDLRAHEHHSFVEEHRKDVICMISGAVLFAAGLILEHTVGAYVLPVCITAYIILGHEVLIRSAKNIARGEVFDENFLMSIATLAAFCIGDFPEAVGVMLFYNIGEMFEDISVDRSRDQIAEAVDMRPETVKLVHVEDHEHAHIHETPAEEIEVGSILQIDPGDRIPLDGIVESGEGIIDTSPVTGEPTPVHAKAGTKILSGCINQRGQFHLKVTAPLAESMVSKILNSVENAAENKPEIEKFITRFAKIYTPIVCALALLVAVLPPLIVGASWKYWIVTAITFLVISCPCALVISVPLAYFLGVGAASRAGILVKSGKALEGLRKIKIIAMDKTGTLTKGIVENTGLLDVDGDVSTDEKTVTFDELKDDAALSVREIKGKGYVTAMLTGDKKARAEEIAAEAGIDEVIPELLPDGKLAALYDLREKHGEIMFVGDGINDAPVLAGADVGAAMGLGADAAIESADIVFMNSNVGAISQIMSIARRTRTVAVQNIVLALGVKFAVILLGLIGFANIWLAIFADTGVAMLCVINTLKLLRLNRK
ncbi:MAG: HAD-IC family P-type ATPase [Bacillota bacterium]